MVWVFEQQLAGYTTTVMGQIHFRKEWEQMETEAFWKELFTGGKDVCGCKGCMKLRGERARENGH
jgi:hypothetical protein